MRISDWSSDVCSSDLLLRRILEESAELVQQIVIDPEGDFVTLADAYNHVVINGGDYNEREIAAMGARIREHRASIILSLESLDIEAQMTCAAAFLNALFEDRTSTRLNSSH